MSWTSRSAENILPYSKEKINLAVALNEWLYTGEMFDLEVPIETCELCNHPDIRYQFNISNQNNGNELLIGSECINKFNIRATDNDGNILSVDGSRKKVNHDRRYLVDEARRKRVITSLIELSKEDHDFDIESFITYLQDRKAFTPNQLSTIFWRFDTHNIEYKKSDYKLTIRRTREKNQMHTMQDWKMRKLWKAMSASQKKWVEDNTGYCL